MVFFDFGFEEELDGQSWQVPKALRQSYLIHSKDNYNQVLHVSTRDQGVNVPFERRILSAEAKVALQWRTKVRRLPISAVDVPEFRVGCPHRISQRKMRISNRGKSG